MNDTLDVLRYWLPGHETAEFYAAGGNMSASDCDHLAAELRRKYLEREVVKEVSTSIGKHYKPGVTIRYEVPCTDIGSFLLADYRKEVFERGDTELLAAIEAGKRLKEALEPAVTREGT